MKSFYSESSDIVIKEYDKFYLSQTQFEVSEYSKFCEEYNKINIIIPLRKSKCKFIFFIILNIITLCIIDLFLAWFPKMNLCLGYSVCTLDKATHIGIFGKDNKLTISLLRKVKVPNINFEEDKFTNSFLTKFNLNFNYSIKYEYFIVFTYKLFDYVFNYDTNKFEALKYSIQTTQKYFHKKFTTGLERKEVSHLKEIFGICDIDIKIHSVMQLLFNELTDPFYLFQLYSFILWYCTEYYCYSTVILILTIVSLFLSVYETRKNLVSLQEISRYSCEVNVYRKNESGQLSPQKMSSIEITPGDLYEIPNESQALPCDTILVEGTVIVNEAMLTGESTPIIKQHMPKVETEFNTEDSNAFKYFLFAGTKIVQKRALPNSKVLGVAYSIGFKTTKGNLIRQILFPKEREEQFKKDSGKYIIFMGCMCIIGFSISLKWLLINSVLEPIEIVKRFMDIITISIPPSLPTSISVGITYAVSRLKKYKILCIARERVNIAGKVNIICFDKTGTLTEDHLDIYGYIPVKLVQGKFYFDQFKDNSIEYSLIAFDHYKKKNFNLSYHDKNKDLKQLYVQCLACCHGITYVNNKLIGDPIDVRMFEGVGWELKEYSSDEDNNNIYDMDIKGNWFINDNYDPLISSYVRPKEEQDLREKISNIKEDEKEDNIIKTHYEIGIVRRFDFVSKLQRMTTITKNINEQYFKAYCKGSPEKLKELCKPDTIPENFNEILASYTSKGYRVLAMASKTMKMNFTQSQQVSRDLVESNMIFLGLLIVRNKLKDVTPSIIKELDSADIRMVMATGDNIFTAISVSRECNLVPPNSIIYTCDMEKDEEGKNQLIWNKVDNFTSDDIDDGRESIKYLINRDYQSKCDENALFADQSSFESFSRKYSGDKLNDTLIIRSINDPFGDDYGEERELYRPSRKNTALEKTTTIPVKTNESFESKKDYFIAITGQNFEELYKLNKKYKDKKEEKYLIHHITFRHILKNGVIFARMAPEHKALLIEAFKQEKFTVLMCGDGANDCAALRAADVGVSLSPEEASIAAHFTSQIPDISCIVKLINEGKCSLTTSIQTFKYMMLYSFIQFLCVTLLIIYQTYLTDFQFLTNDLFIIFPLSIFIARTGPYHKITHRYPNGSLLSFPIITSIAIQTVIIFTFQLVGRIVLKILNGTLDSDIPNTTDSDFNVKPCEDNTILFLISNCQYLTSAIAFSVSKPFRQPIFKNIILMIYLLLVILYSVWITIHCDNWSLKLFNLVVFENKKMKYWLLTTISINFVLSILFEWVIMRLVNMCWERNEISRYRKKILNYDEGNQIGDEYSIYEYQRVFFHDRRKTMEEGEKLSSNRK